MGDGPKGGRRRRRIVAGLAGVLLAAGYGYGLRAQLPRNVVERAGEARALLAADSVVGIAAAQQRVALAARGRFLDRSGLSGYAIEEGIGRDPVFLHAPLVDLSAPEDGRSVTIAFSDWYWKVGCATTLTRDDSRPTRCGRTGLWRPLRRLGYGELNLTDAYRTLEEFQRYLRSQRR